jgi:hypothetical protein
VMNIGPPSERRSLFARLVIAVDGLATPWQNRDARI